MTKKQKLTLNEVTKVIFRKYKEGGDILALFPELPGTTDPATCLCYEHVGQHGAGNYYHCIDNLTVSAKPEEYADLKAELENIGYRLQVMKKSCWRYFHKRKEGLI
jgi:hypothetical protein